MSFGENIKLISCSEDWRGEIYRVNYSQPQRDSHFSVPLEQVETWYLALRQFTQLMLDKDNCVQYKLSPG
jgi:gamma-butyrobetaine dioxygenase